MNAEEVFAGGDGGQMVLVTRPASADPLEQEIAVLGERVRRLAVVDGPSFQRAGAMLLEVKTGITRVHELFDGTVKATDEAHKAAVRQRGLFLTPLEAAERYLGRGMADYEQAERRRQEEAMAAARREQARIEAEAQQRAEEEQKRLEAEAETRKAQAAVTAALAGDPDGAERILATPTAVPVVVAAPVIAPTVVTPPPPKAEGITFRDHWTGRVVDFGALVQAVAAGQAPLSVLRADQNGLDALARSTKGTLVLPGVEWGNQRIAAGRRS